MKDRVVGPAEAAGAEHRKGQSERRRGELELLRVAADVKECCTTSIIRIYCFKCETSKHYFQFLIRGTYIKINASLCLIMVDLQVLLFLTTALSREVQQGKRC